MISIQAVLTQGVKHLMLFLVGFEIATPRLNVNCVELNTTAADDV